MDAAEPTVAEFTLSSYDGTVDIDRRDLSFAANELLADATLLCRELHHRMVEPVHVAWVLFSGADCASDSYRELGLTLLQRAGVDHTKCVRFLEDEMEIACERATVNRAPSFSVHYVKWIQEAQYEAELYRDQLISIGHLAVALAIHLQQYGEQAGFAERRFRLAAERVRGLAPLAEDVEDDDEHLTVDIDAALLAEAEKDGLAPTKLDRVSPASSAPDSPPESERRDSTSTSTADELPTFTDDILDALTVEEQEEYWRALVLQEQEQEQRQGGQLSDDSLSDHSDETVLYDVTEDELRRFTQQKEEGDLESFELDARPGRADAEVGTD
jgi:ATP-dependent Clp protease ATP-binding subunit ClpA